jgi:haloalkane dehalogenase
LPKSMIHDMTAKQLEVYQAPYLTPESRKPLWQYVQEVPLGKGESEVTRLIDCYSAWLQSTSVPKLLLYAVPGFMTTMDTVQWARDHFDNLTLVGLDDVLHFAQESIPEVFSQHLGSWYETL